MLTSLFSLFYVTREFHRFLHRGRAEKPTKYFFNMEKKSYNKKVISELKRSDGKTIVKEQDIMIAIQTFYENLCSSDIDHSGNEFYDFSRDLQFAKLSDELEEKINLDSEITLEECETILNTFQNGKSPGMMVIQLSSTNNFSVS